MRAPQLDVAAMQKVGEGREAEMFAMSDGRILRLYRPGISARAVMQQAFRQRLAVDAGIRAPQIYEYQVVEERFGIVMERIDGADLLTEAGKKPWRIFDIASRCGRAHARVNSVLAPPSLQTVTERYTAILAGLEAKVPGEYLDAARDALSSLPEGSSLCHLDFHPANVMEQNGKTYVIDWSNASRGPAEADFARSTLILQLGDPPPGTAMTLRLLALGGRHVFKAFYSRAYRKEIRLDPEQLYVWALPTAVARLGDGIEAEREPLLAYIRKLVPSLTYP